MELKTIPIAEIVSNTGQIKGLPKNPRLIKNERFKALKKSITDEPEMLNLRELLVYPVGKKFVVIGGNMRLKACEELGFTELPCKVLDRETPVEKLKAYTIKDNISFGENDWGLMQTDWNEQELADWGFEMVNFVKEELKATDDDFNVPEGGMETDIVLGDIFEIGEHRLLCGDSTKKETFEKLFKDELADLVITDPLYNVAYEGKTKDALTIENDNMSNDDFYKFLFNFYKALGAHTKKGGAWYVWHADSEGANFRQAMKDAGIMVKQCLIWVKNTMVMGRQDYQWKHEPCLYGWKEGASHNWYSDRKQTTILEFNKPSRNAEHPTMKPVELFAYQVENSSDVNQIVADAFGGSGTTMVVCEQIKRKARVVEFDPRYCQVIIERMIKLNPMIKITKNGEKYTKD